MGIWANIFGSSKVIDAGINGLDKIVYTDEEKADAKQAFLKLYEPYKLAQRILMMIIAIPYVICTFILFTLSFFMGVAAQQEILAGDIGTAFTLVVVFYFGGGAAEGIVSKFRK